SRLATTSCRRRPGRRWRLRRPPGRRSRARPPAAEAAGGVGRHRRRAGGRGDNDAVTASVPGDVPPSSRPGRLGVGVVGAGRVGAVLGSALRAAGHSVVGASAVSEDSRDRVDALLPGVPVLEVPEIVERAELVLLTVPDDALAGLVQGIADTGGWQ